MDERVGEPAAGKLAGWLLRAVCVCVCVRSNEHECARVRRLMQG